ncbi:hypothetical protein [Maliponia aquimaris]|uniref:Uncharacterized protein n=1 Tax=Maliponia aquimaris TaxID=1673631 RepID=A0A238L6M0_9RHOB|nr:hypothetical protein [Maliponia aquimaris]SMX50763.1 hypothetical protein MAA8898_04974 [Maliponia aquimaris]
MTPTLRTTLAALVLATPAFASGPGEHSPGSGDVTYLGDARLTYEVFEQAVTHVDLENCPAQFDPDVVFCRMTLANEMANVFVFSFADDQPLLAVKAYALDSEFLPF